jgi:hypothetical protein
MSRNAKINLHNGQPSSNNIGIVTMPPPTTGGDSLLHLRTITATLTATPEVSLPAAIPQIAAQLYSSPIIDDALAIAAEKEDALVVCNKFKSRVAALLQSRVPQARWAGVVIVKVAVEASAKALEAWAGSWVKVLVGLISVGAPLGCRGWVTEG